MLKEHERREYLKSLDQEKREREEKRMEDLKEKHRQHPKVNAPVGTNAFMLAVLSESESSSLTFFSSFCCVFPTLRVVLLSYGKFGRRRTDWIPRSSTQKHFLNCMVSSCNHILVKLISLI